MNRSEVMWLAFLVSFLLFGGFVIYAANNEVANKRSNFFRDHQCVAITNGYHCGDGAVME